MKLNDLVPDPGAVRREFAEGKWCEGPCWLPDKQVLRFSDVIGNKVYDLSPNTGNCIVHLDNPDHVNGRVWEPSGSVIQCSHGGRRIERDDDGKISVIVDHYGKARFNSPNDVVISSDGSIWFTDPAYGIIYPAEGHPGSREYCDHFVFRIDPNGRLHVAAADLVEPNGLAFSPDEKILYIADSALLNRDGTFGRHHIRRYLVDDWRLKAGDDFVEVSPGVPDGIKVDEHGNLWSSSLDAVIIFDPDGNEIGRIPIPEKIGNLCFGGDDGTTLFIAASTSIYSLPTSTRDSRYLSGRA